jgi:SAM-dependent methyltransferase
MSDQGDYILGTGNDEAARLGLQHRVWRARALDAWFRAGFTVGQTLLDIGCGPGHASIDLAEIVGASGRVIAIDRSRRFIEALEINRLARGLQQLATRELNLEQDDLPQVGADGAWCRWVLSFVKNPRALLTRIGSALRRGGVLVLHEYFDYGSWRMIPRSRDIEEFVAVVMESWRADGGEPNIGLELPPWLAESGFTVTTVRPIIDVVSPSNYIWQWPKTFFHSNLSRLVELRRLTPERARTMAKAFAACEEAPHTRMITPGVLEIMAVRS